MGSNPPIRAVPFQQAQPSVHIARFLKRTLPYVHEHRRRGLDYFRRSRQGGDVLLPEDWDLNVAYGNEDLAAAAAAVAKAVSSSQGGGSGSLASASSPVSPTTPAGLANMSPMSLAAFASLAAQREGRGQRVPNLVVRGGAVKTIDGERGKHGLRNARRNLDPYPHIPHQRVVAHGDLMSHGPAPTPVTASPDRSFLLQNLGNLGLPTTSTPARPTPATPSSSMPMFPAATTLSLQEQLMAMFGVNNFHELQAAARAHHATRQRILALQQQKATSPSAPVVAEPGKAASPSAEQRDASGGGARVKSDSVQAGAGRLTLAPAAGIFARGVASQPFKVAQGDAEPLRNPAATVAFDENRFLGIGRLPSPQQAAADRTAATAAPAAAAPPPFPFLTQQATPQTQRTTTASTAQQQRTLPTFDIARHADPLAAVPDAFLSQPAGPNWSHLFQQLDATQQPQPAQPQLQRQVSPVNAGAHLRAPNFGQRSPTPHALPTSAAATVQWSNWANNASSTITAQQQADPSSAGGGAHSPADLFSPSRPSQNRLQGWSPIPAAYAVPGANANANGSGNTNGNAASPNGTLRAVSADDQRWEQQFGTDWYRPVSAPPQPSFVVSNELPGDLWADMANAAANATPIQEEHASPTWPPATHDRAQPAQQQQQQQQQDASSIPAADWILAAPSPCNVDGTRPTDPVYDSTATGSFLPTPESTNYQPYSPFGVDAGASAGRHPAPAPYSYGQPADKAGLDLAGKLAAPARSPMASADSPFDLGASPFGALDAKSPPAFGLDAFGFDSLLDPTFASLEPQHQAQHQTPHAFGQTAQRVHSPRAPF